MELDFVVSLDRSKLEEMTSKLGIEVGFDCEIEELHALLYSFIASNVFFDKAYELCCLFDEPFELIHSLIESSEGILNSVVLNAILEIKSNPVDFIPITSNTHFAVANCKVNIGTSFVLLRDEGSVNDGDSDMFIKCGEGKRCAAVINVSDFGNQDFDIVQNSLKSSPSHQVLCRFNVFASSGIYSYCMSLDAVLDRLFWGWEGAWDSELEATLLELLVAVDSDLVPVVLRMNTMMGGMMGAAKELEAMMTSVQDDLTAALTTHAPYALGRLHQTALELRDMNSGMMGSMFNLPDSLIRAIDGFIQAKIQKSPQLMLSRQINSLVSYVALWTWSVYR